MKKLLVLISVLLLMSCSKQITVQKIVSDREPEVIPEEVIWRDLYDIRSFPDTLYLIKN